MSFGNWKKAIDFTVPAGIVGYAAIKTRPATKDPRALVNYIAILALIGVISYIIVSQITKAAMNSYLSGVRPKDQEKIMAENGVSDTTFKRMQTVATTIYGAFHDSKWTEDEDKAINAVNSCNTPAEVKTLCDVYRTLYNVSLQGEFAEYTTYFDTLANPIKAVVKENWY